MALRIYLLLSLILCGTFPVAAQKNLSTEDAITGSKTYLAPRNFMQYGWLNRSGKYFAIDTLQENTFCVTGQAGKTSAIAICSLHDLNVFLLGKGLDSLSKFPLLKPTGEDRLTAFLPPGNVLEVKTSGLKAVFALRKIEVPQEAEHVEFSDNGKLVAFTIKNNLYLSKDSTVIPITADANEDIISGQAVHRNEFGINKGIFWSPEGNYLAFYKMDQRMVKNYPVVNWDEMPAKVEDLRYPMSGGPSHQVRVGIYNPKTKSSIFLQVSGDPEQYLTNISWTPDEKQLLVAVVNRQQNRMWLNAYNASSGKQESTLLEERNEKYVEPLNPAFFLRKKSELFIWQSTMDGHNHLYLYNTEGSLVRRLNKGNWEVLKLLGTDSDDKYAYFIANVTSPLNRDLCRVAISGGETEVLSKESGVHNILPDAACKFFFDWHQSASVPGVLSTFTVGKPASVLIKAENPIASYTPVGMRLGSIPSGSTPLYYRLFTPAGFDSSRKYPCIVYMYNGPHVQSVTNSWLGGSSNLWFHQMAQQGYVVFTIDGRGSDNRGRDFEQATFRQLGKVESEDQLAGLQWLKNTGFVDPARIGIFGWSFGGFMTTTLMTENPGVFKVGVAGGPVIDWNWYEVMYTERYMDRPDENPEGYANSSLIGKAGNLKDRLLMIHGTDDDVVVWQHSLRFVKACISKGALIDYMVYPGHLHNVTGKDRVHLFKTITRYFKDHL
jgi:dipeptidyl-peptidase-4